ncbi:MAG: hypothetical protein ABSC33_14830 [Candidatus Sulfotelmatobacter sp.]
MKGIVVVVLGGVIFASTVPRAKAQLTCSPAPCVTSNVTVSSSASNTTVAGMVLAASPVSSSQNFAITANDLVGMKYCYGLLGDSSESAVFTSSDFAVTWSGGCQPPSGPNFGPNYDPIAAYDNAGNLFSGQLGVSNTLETVFMQELAAGSSTWGSYFPTLAYTDQSTEDFYDYDFPGMAIDNSRPLPVLYVTAWEKGLSNPNTGPVTAIAVGQSYDGGVTWTTGRVSDILTGTSLAQYSRLAVTKNSKVLVTWIQNTGGNAESVYAALSGNRGVSWTTPTKIFNISQPAQAGAECATNYPEVNRVLPHTCVRMFYFPQLASTYNSSAAANQFNAIYPNFNGTNVAIEYRSSLNGTKWSAPLVLSSVTADQFEPCIASASSGSATIGVAWLDTRNSPAGGPDTLYDAYGIVSTDGGSTWSSVYRLSSESGGTSVETEPQSEYLGDWTGCAWKGGIFYYAFPSTANGLNQVATIVGLNP